jgi:hypothetical protein
VVRYFFPSNSMFSGKIELISYTGLYILKSVLEVLSAIFG